jgi:alkylation response protein AidB-like acyl-CoA dehydrogenase
MTGDQPAWMDEEHILFQESVSRFFASELVPHMDAWRKQGVVDREFWNTAGAAGLLGASIPEIYGGAGGTLAHDAVIAREHALTGDSSWGWAVHNIVVHYLVTFVTDDQKRRWLPRMATGELVGAIAMTEPGTGSDLQSVTTRAVKEGDTYRLNGAKSFITNGQTANFVIVVAKTGADEGAKGISLLVIETDDAKGFRRGRCLRKIGLNGQDTSELFFDDVEVPAENLLGDQDGLGFTQLMEQLPWERLLIGIGAVGACDAMLGETLSYVRERKAFDQRIMDFQNTRFKLAECKTKTEVTRAFVNQCMGKILHGTLDPATASMAKYWAAQVQCEVADECLQLFGGYGYMMEYPIARAFVDARVQQIYGGTKEIMKELIARAMDTDMLR